MTASMLNSTITIPSDTVVSYISVLHKCSAKMEGIQQIHANLIKTGIVFDTMPANRLLDALCSNSTRNSLSYALQFFATIPNPNTYMWNSVIRALSNSNHPDDAVLLYCQMLYSEAQHNAYTFPFLLKACASLSSVAKETQQIHCSVIKLGFISEVHTVNSLIHVYVKSGCINSATKLFNRSSCRDTVTCNTMIDGYMKRGMVQLAREVFDMMESRSVVSWTSMISGYTQCRLFNEALEIFREMLLVDVEVDAVALTSALTACAHLGALDQGKWIHDYIKARGIQLDSVLGCVLVDMYAKCGELDEALAVFKTVREKNVSVWTAMITGFAVHGLGREALEMLNEMEMRGVRPNYITFTSVLTACSYVGMIEEGKLQFDRMTKVYKMTPSIEHYGCMVDLLGRAGMLKEAEYFISAMPIQPNAAVWGSLLNACRIHRNLELGKYVGKILIELDPKHGGRYIQLSSILAAEGNWNEAMKVRKLMKESKVLKLPGCSSICINGNVHEFVVGDRLHPQTAQIYEEWNNILQRLKEEGYMPFTENLLLDLEEDEKETAIQLHSEKLAIAFALINTKPGKPLKIFKNLRICTDCHIVCKLISKVYDRKIIMRDRMRFHVFQNGNCSCRDYW